MVNKHLPWIGVAAIAIWIVIDMSRLVAANWAFTTDDTYITLRYAHNLAHGDGVTWNPGEEPVEGYSNFSYVLVGAAALAVDADPVLVFKLLGLAALAGTCVMLFLLARCWVGPLASAIPALLLTRYLGSAYWVTSGLETPVYQFLVVASVTMFARALRERVPSRRGLVVSSGLAFLASLTRPEGPLVAISLAIALVLHVIRADGSWRERAGHVLVFALAFAIPYTVYFGWRLVQFERLLPNSVACKALYGGDDMQLVHMYRALALPYAVPALVHDWRKIDARIVAMLLVPLAYVFVLRGVDPIIGAYNRHALTAWTLLLVPAVIGAANAMAWLRVPERRREWFVLVFALVWMIVDRGLDRRAVLGAHTLQYAERSNDRHDVGRWLRDRLGPTDAYVVGDCGVIPYVAGGVAIDAFCLNNREMTEPPIRGSRTKLIDRIYERAPRYLVVHSQSSAALKPRPEYGFYEALVSDPRFASYEHRVTFGGSGGAFAYWIYQRR
ncbi:MAG: hypothetical protein ACKV2T_40305 [Kofleriaceae bacterium]